MRNGVVHSWHIRAAQDRGCLPETRMPLPWACRDAGRPEPGAAGAVGAHRGFLVRQKNLGLTPCGLGPWIQVCSEPTHWHSRRSGRHPSMQITDFVDVVNQPSPRPPRLLKYHRVSIAEKKMSKKNNISTWTNLLFVHCSHRSVGAEMMRAVATGVSPTKGLGLIIQSQTVLILGLLAMTI